MPEPLYTGPMESLLFCTKQMHINSQYKVSVQLAGEEGVKYSIPIDTHSALMTMRGGIAIPLFSYTFRLEPTLPTHVTFGLASLSTPLLNP